MTVWEAEEIRRSLISVDHWRTMYMSTGDHLDWTKHDQEAYMTIIGILEEKLCCQLADKNTPN